MKMLEYFTYVVHTSIIDINTIKLTRLRKTLFSANNRLPTPRSALRGVYT